MRLVPANAMWLGKYQSLAQDRNIGYEPTLSRLGILVAEERELVAGVMVYDTSGPFLFFESLVTNETASLRMRHRALEAIIEEGFSVCRHMAKIPMIAVRHKSIERIMEKQGLYSFGAKLMTCAVNRLEATLEP